MELEGFNSILVGIDMDVHGELSPGCQAAVTQALHLASAHNASVTLEHVIDIDRGALSIMEIEPQSVLNEARGIAEQSIARIRTENPQVSIEGKIGVGPHWKALIRSVLDAKHDLVILGTHARSRVRRALFGSTANRVLRHCPAPVWIVSPGDKLTHRHVLVAHDLGETGSRTLHIAAGLASYFGAQLRVLHVVEHVEYQLFLGKVSPKVLRQRENERRARLEAECRTLPGSPPVHIEVTGGNPHTEILHCIEKHNIDLLCMGTVGRNGASGVITGNTAENVLPWIDCSLLAVKPRHFHFQPANSANK